MVSLITRLTLEKSDHRSASNCFGRLFDPRRRNTYTQVALGVAEDYTLNREIVRIETRSECVDDARMG